MNFSPKLTSTEGILLVSICLLLVTWFVRNKIRSRSQHSKNVAKKLPGHLVIDGCNGPIKIRMRRERQGRIAMSVTFAISRNGKTIDLIAKLKERCESATLVFDGCSKHWPVGVSNEEGFEWWAPKNNRNEGSLRVLVTSHNEEADHAIIRMDEDSQNHCSENEHSCQVRILKLTRSDQGPGRQKSFMRPLGLQQPRSVACLFPNNSFSSNLGQQAKDIIQQVSSHQFESLLQVDQHFPATSNLIITASDDIYLRRRVRFCMTFRQLWDFLQEDRLEWPSKVTGTDIKTK